MRCPYLKIDPIARCLAYDGIRIVRKGELEQFCRGEQHLGCRIYLDRALLEKEGGGLAGKKHSSKKNFLR